ncbi:ligase-associated DNA damage response endonuclease PdeM [Pseudanabaena sp. FACHB-2040]|uniref:ligase-associated DNA damage response endonuclease PdeM n=1 Tax=Pseudanabaena sp. FACHB-2040 TaxID=2692859 RepID=UPI0016866C35|nr:ligase-associated DNA damage response endonuclease PdeM [Pseudanabaena sp. FACHB-2040]MBD2256392.1 ligase-associated DNA damage response endonuclease PdeM [Pseudanabaena sp. FACHB-2040]
MGQTQGYMQEIVVDQLRLQLLPEKAVYVEEMRSLLVSDLHLGKSETFQSYGLPVSNQVNQATLQRLEQACNQVKPDYLWILGDLFHAQEGLVDEVIDGWLKFLHRTQVTAHLVLGNHDRPLPDLFNQLTLVCFTEAVITNGLILSHEPYPSASQLNICGHIHPCVRLKSRLDTLRLPCFYWEPHRKRLTLPSFGDFTGGYEVPFSRQAIAYVIAEDQVLPLLP